MAQNGEYYHNEKTATSPSLTRRKRQHSIIGGDHPWPPPEEHSRAAEFYGFVAWTSTYLFFIIYLLWAFLPDEYIVWLGVTWYPNR